MDQINQGITNHKDELDFQIKKRSEEIQQKINFLRDSLKQVEAALAGQGTLNSLGVVQSIGPEIDRLIAELCSLKIMMATFDYQILGLKKGAQK